MSVIPMKALLESGVHFGHRTQKWHPAMKPYIFTERNGIHIIDLQKTVKAVEVAYALVRDTVAEGGNVLFVGTKRQAQETIQNEATRSGMPYVTERWLGGMLTNWRTIRQRINELERLERMRDSGDFERITKKEALLLTRVIERLEILLGGIRNMVRVPELLFVVDVQREATAIHEANLLEIHVVGMVDTNCDPRYVDYVIPSNDDAIRAIKLMVGKIADAAVEGRGMRKEEVGEEVLPIAAQAFPEEAELTDEELLGEATLAKITPKTEPLEGVLEETLEEAASEMEEEFDLNLAEEKPEYEEAEEDWQVYAPSEDSESEVDAEEVETEEVEEEKE